MAGSARPQRQRIAGLRRARSGAGGDPHAEEATASRAGRAPLDVAALRLQRAAVLASALLAAAAGYAWLAPFVVPGRLGLPFGCGSPAHPNVRGFPGRFCSAETDVRSLATLVLLVAAVVCALLAAALPGMPRRARLYAAVLGLLCAVPLLVAATITLLMPLEARSIDGTPPVSCGRAIQPATDRLARGLCADLPRSRLAAGVALAVGGLILGTGVSYIASAATTDGARRS